MIRPDGDVGALHGIRGQEGGSIEGFVDVSDYVKGLPHWTAAVSVGNRRNETSRRSRHELWHQARLLRQRKRLLRVPTRQVRVHLVRIHLLIAVGNLRTPHSDPRALGKGAEPRAVERDRRRSVFAALSDGSLAGAFGPTGVPQGVSALLRGLGSHDDRKQNPRDHADATRVRWRRGAPRSSAALSPGLRAFSGPLRNLRQSSFHARMYYACTRKVI
eukprot:scaffold7768_cov277-Pinguiococcus_pyrenoidosus.AAC.5